MKTSKIIFTTFRQNAINTELLSHKLMLKACLIKKLSSGIYSWLPLGTRVIIKIQKIIRKAMNDINACEIIMPSIVPFSFLKETKRDEKFGKELLTMIDNKNRKLYFAPTHEEPAIEIIRNMINSYNQLPIILYQIQNKFRDEIRPRFGVIRSREFIMKDAYSFHESEICMKNTYMIMKEVYSKILKHIGLNFKIIEAESGFMNGGINQEFHVVIKNKYVMKYSINSIEIAHIFQLEKYYSNLMQAVFKNNQGTSKQFFMGCYGFGISRVIAAIIENNNDKNGIIWPENVAPFQILILGINLYKQKHVYDFVYKLYNKMLENNFEVLLEDRKLSTGVIFNDADLIGIPNQIIVSDKGLKNSIVEHKIRSNNKIIHISSDISKIINYFNK